MQASPPVERPGIEPLVRAQDLADFREGLARYQSGAWDETRWASFRLRFGVYAQREAGVQMVRVRLPGGIVTADWLRAVARAARDFARGPVHLTTRQDVQLYGVAASRVADLLARLSEAGITTREAGGNTVRNVTACALAGLCPAERVDAGAVAERLSRAWLRHPLVQNMPRKLKITVSGCETDCGAAPVHDLGLIATERDGRPGFRVLAGGGLGGAPVLAVEVLPFVVEEELPLLVETLARLHVAHSNRQDRAQARLKFVLRRLGAERFAQLFAEEFSRLRGLDQRPWSPLAWRQPAAAAPEPPAAGPLAGHDGTHALLIPVPLGLITPDQLDGLAAILLEQGQPSLRVTRDQSILLPAPTADGAAALVAAVAALGLDASPRAAETGRVVSCPGAATCRIGLTTSRALGERLHAVAAAEGGHGLAVHLSGCHNGCGLHLLAPIGLRGVSRGVDGRPAPHYRVHLLSLIHISQGIVR